MLSLSRAATPRNEKWHEFCIRELRTRNYHGLMKAGHPCNQLNIPASNRYASFIRLEVSVVISLAPEKERHIMIRWRGEFWRGIKIFLRMNKRIDCPEIL